MVGPNRRGGGQEGRATTRLWIAATVVVALGCNDHPLQRLDKVITAASGQEFGLPAKTKIDFLFVIDNSGSMCEEQDNLTENFGLFADFLDSLGDSADYRIAITSTDLRTNGHRGKFLSAPAEAVPARNCFEPLTREPFVPNTADCPPPGQLPTILKSGPAGNIADRDDLETKFRCLATLGTNGDAFEKGLEAMRVSLSCDGPNQQYFNQCCVGDKYDPNCPATGDGVDPLTGLPIASPEFLRPDAVLIVVFITDEDDCSAPSDNPGDSMRAICKYGHGDNDRDGIPDGYRDKDICDPLDSASCFQNECGGLLPDECHARRCVISRSENSNCEWLRDELVPIDDYYDFLIKLKRAPEAQIVVAAITGHRAFTESGFELFFNPPPPPEQRDQSCNPESELFDQNKSYDECCPGGQCEGPIEPSCESANGIAFTGRRYLELAERFDASGIGCPASASPDDTANCVHICTDDFATPLGQIRDKIINVISNYCLDKRPTCVFPPVFDELTGSLLEPARACENEVERADTHNYAIELRMSCRLLESEGGSCPQLFENRPIPAADWQLDLTRSDCPGGASVKLNTPPPAGAEVFIDFLVDVSSTPEPAPDSGLPAPNVVDPNAVDPNAANPDGGGVPPAGP